MAIQRQRKKLEEIESRFYSWTHLSDQQEEDITWLINTLKEGGKISEIVEVTKLPDIKVMELANLTDNKIYFVQDGKIVGIIEEIGNGS